MSRTQAGLSPEWIFGLLLAVAAAGCSPSTDDQSAGSPSRPPEPTAALVDEERINRARRDEPGAWLAHGRTYEEQRFSPLTQINRETIKDLGLAWSNTIGIRHRLQFTPLVVDGVMYYPDSWGVVYAVDARTGEQIWSFDPKTSREVARWGCCGGPLNRGVAIYKGRVYVSTFDARLVAIDAATGEKVWEAETGDYPSRVPYTVTGAPRAAAGKVYIGQSGSEFGQRGYLTAYDAETGEKAWRFFTVPGDPSQPFEHPEMELAAKTWNGEWWKLGGGGTVWNSIVYDPELHTLYIGAGNGAPWSRRIRSPGGGDNLFLVSIIAVDPDSGAMKWYYQTTPGDNWDYTAVQDMVLGEMVVDGRERKVLLQAPKNGFFYVLDRTNGELLRAHPFGAVTWATHVDMATGRPVENPEAAWEEKPQWVLPGAGGAHNWQAMSFDQQRGVMYIPTHDLPFFFALPEEYAKTGIFKPLDNSMIQGVVIKGSYRRELIAKAGALPETKGYLKAFDPLTGKTLWAVENATVPPRAGSLRPRVVIGGVLATAGGVVFQGDGFGTVSAYNTDNGERLWKFESYGAIQAPPISYEIDGTQYVALVASANFDYDNYGKLMVFALGGETELAEPPKRDRSIPEQPPLTASAEELVRGDELYHQFCFGCHGYEVRGARNADLRMMAPAIHDAFQGIVRDGLLRELGMNGFADALSEEDVELVRQYIISRANLVRAEEAEEL